MKELNIDLDLLLESFSINEDDLGKEYLDTNTGEVINIPSELEGIAKGSFEESKLEDWQKELVEEAYKIKKDNNGRYIIIPTIPEDYINNAMRRFVDENIVSKDIEDKLKEALNGNSAFRSFKSVLFENHDDLDKWHEYEEHKLKDYVVSWLFSNNITMK
ncbi:UPF0158 family protein [Clostridium algidicarnis]|uniref:UPF0158 family protein n=1 Tax=Clostridium algidicarnis TaxID=37659 RepID=UPI001C0E769E|nr:UPF0158 family protein [Clostridium algidicarnis]MBU3209481.1 UPF0158 family protein [Clostridium algidicarnis]MBU3227264.1 UPF0158 family protein [Clostridium algidicarnis]MBU3250788.1 UPF0158 family protein [Clostridium algidicarnis]